MNSRERVKAALEHKKPDRIPLDLGGSTVTGMHVSTVYKLRQALQLDSPNTPVKVIEPFQMLGEIKADLREILGVDFVSLSGSRNMFGFENKGWKEWKTFDGTPVLIPQDFNTEVEENGDILMYPQGDKDAIPSARMPKNGWYFDAIIRQEEIKDDQLLVEDNLEEFTIISEEELAYLKNEAQSLYTQTDKAIFANFGGTSFGDIALVPGLQLKNPRGIRDIEEWYISTVTRTEHIYNIFAKQCEIALYNLGKIYGAVGNRVAVVFVSGTDFGTQNGPFISTQMYSELYKPFHQKINSWIHRNTNWKTFIHSCGSVMPLISEFIDAGFDILNPIQCSAANMDPQELKNRFGNKLCFWGGGVDTQKTLPFGTPAQVRNEVAKQIEILASGGGFVFNTIHNCQAKIPMENILAMYQSLHENWLY